MTIELKDAETFVNEVATRINADLPPGRDRLRVEAAVLPQWIRLTGKQRSVSPNHFMFISRESGDAFKAASSSKPAKTKIGNFLTDREALLDVAARLGRSGMVHFQTTGVVSITRMD